MNPNRVEVDIVALKELQDELIRLSKTIQGISEFMKRNEATLSDSWKDQKYYEFKEAFDEAIKLCESISKDYRKWALIDLQSNIDAAIDIKKVVVGNPSNTSRGANDAKDEILFMAYKSKEAANEKNPVKSANMAKEAVMRSPSKADKIKARIYFAQESSSLDARVNARVQRAEMERQQQLNEEMAAKLMKQGNEDVKNLTKKAKETNINVNSKFNDYLSGQMGNNG